MYAPIEGREDLSEEFCETLGRNCIKIIIIPNLEDIQLLFEIFSDYCVLRPLQANQKQRERTFLSGGPQYREQYSFV